MAPKVIILISVATLGTTQYTYAQSTQDWTLTVYVVRVPFGESTIHLEVQGPFGNHLYDNIPNSQHPSTAFDMPGDQYPTGYYYRVCVSSNIVGFFLPHCYRYVHGEGDESVRVRP
jgi:hypothetical protein